MMKFTKKRHLALLILICTLFVPGSAGSAFADTMPLFVLPETSLYSGLGRADDPVPAKSALRTGTLANGLTYFILENSLPGDRAYLTLAVKAGSILEEDHERGFAHFVEHLAFCGTRRFPGSQLVDYLRSLGMRFGPEVNAYTSFEETVYGIETPIEIDENGIKRIPDRALAILDDWTWGVTFNPEDVEKERSIILEEYRTRLGARERVRQQTLPVIFRGSRFKDRLPIGLPEILQNATAEQLKAFYQKWYRPDNMAVILVGDFDGEVLEKELALHFTAPASADPLVRPYFELPDPQKGSVIAAVVSDEELTNTIISLYYKRSPQAHPRTLKTYREILLNYLIETMINFRFEEKIAGGNTPYLGGYTWNSRYGQYSRYFVMAASAKSGQSRETLEALVTEKERLARFGFSRAELDRTKGSLLSTLERMTAEKDRQESEHYIEELTADFLKNQFALDIEWEYEAVKRLLPGIGLIAVNSAMNSYFADDDAAVIIASGETALPDEETIITIVKESRNAVVDRPKEREVRGSLINEEIIPGSVVSVVNDESGAEIWKLSNGMELILVPTANKNNELDFYALARGGTIHAGVSGNNLLDGLGFSPLEAYYSALFAAEIQSASGLGPFSKPELMDFLSDKQLSLSFWTGNNTRGLRGSSSVKDLSFLFQLLYGTFSQPRIDQNGMSLVLDYHRTRLLQEEDNPEAYFSKERNRMIYSDNPLFKPLELSDLDHISEKAALAFLNLALNPADYTFVFAGSIGDRKEFQKLAETWLASVPNQGLPGWNNWIDPEIKRPLPAEKIIYRGKEEKCIVYMGYFAPKTWTEKGNGDVLVLNDYLDIVLTDEIREKLGGVYSISSRASFSPAPAGELSLEIFFICDPGRQAELREAVKNQLKLLSAAADKETLERAKEALVKNFERSMESNGFIARNMANFTVITNSPLANLRERPGLYRSATGQDLSSLVTELLTGGPAEMILLPESADK